MICANKVSIVLPPRHHCLCTIFQSPLELKWYAVRYQMCRRLDIVVSVSVCAQYSSHHCPSPELAPATVPARHRRCRQLVVAIHTRYLRFGCPTQKKRNQTIAIQVSTVSLGGGDFEFRNPPHFMSFSAPPTEDAAAQETEALLDHLFWHDNTTLFIALRTKAGQG